VRALDASRCRSPWPARSWQRCGPGSGCWCCAEADRPAPGPACFPVWPLLGPSGPRSAGLPGPSRPEPRSGNLSGAADAQRLSVGAGPGRNPRRLASGDLLHQALQPPAQAPSRRPAASPTRTTPGADRDRPARRGLHRPGTTQSPRLENMTLVFRIRTQSSSPSPGGVVL
jgi:hypothetical protein